jgi:hypothetical protein
MHENSLLNELKDGSPQFTAEGHHSVWGEAAALEKKTLAAPKCLSFRSSGTLRLVSIKRFESKQIKIGAVGRGDESCNKCFEGVGGGSEIVLTA